MPILFTTSGIEGMKRRLKRQLIEEIDDPDATLQVIVCLKQRDEFPENRLKTK
jgi:hypothetical protein